MKQFESDVLDNQIMIMRALAELLFSCGKSQEATKIENRASTVFARIVAGDYDD